MSKVAAAVFWFLLPCWAFVPLFAAVRLTVGQPAPAALDWAVILGSAALAAANPRLHQAPAGAPVVASQARSPSPLPHACATARL